VRNAGRRGSLPLVQEAWIRRRELVFEGCGGLDLFARSWLPDRPERAILLVHGWAEHSGRYEHVGAWLAARGCAVHAYDHRGHGRSGGPRGHARRFEDLLDDLEIALSRVREETPGLPLFLVGHSMGGLVAAAFAVERAPAVSGVVTSGAALAVADVPSRAQLFALRLLARVAPRLHMDRPIATDALSRDPEVGRAYAEDPAVLRRMTLAMGAGFLSAVGRTVASADRVRVPMLLLHGGDDPLCPSEGSRRFFEGLSSPASDLRVYPGLRHEIFNEPERESVFEDVLGWMRRTAPRAAAAPSSSEREARRAV
jgi:alpha-beta hydrolase superfamily lysophospholipase